MSGEFARNVQLERIADALESMARSLQMLAFGEVEN